MSKLSPRDIAYNACVDLIAQKQREALTSLDEYNRAVRAAESLYRLNCYTELELLPKKG